MSLLVPGIARATDAVAASSGFTLIKHKRPEPGTYARTAAQMELMGMFGPGISVLNWINPDFDEAILNRTVRENFGPAIHAALARAATLGMPLEFVGYLTSADPIVIDRFEAQVTGRGQAILANINPEMSEPFITVDGSGQAALSAVIEGLSVETGGIENAVLFRRPHRSTFSRISVRDCRGVAVRIEGSVDDKFYRLDVADKGRPFGATPEYGFLVTGYVHHGDPKHAQSVAHCSHLTIEHCRVNRASVAGWNLMSLAGSRLSGTSSEALSGVGMISHIGSRHNRISGMWFEGNSGGDLIEYGRHNSYTCVFGSRPPNPGPYLAPRAVTVKAGAEGIVFDQCETFSATVEAGAVGTIFEPLLLIYDDVRAFEDNGSGTQVRGRRMGAEAAFIPE